MPKKKAETPRREITKRQLSRWQQQKRRQRIILAAGITVIVASLGTVGTGWYLKEYKPLHQIAIKVNDTEFSIGYYVKMLELYGKGGPTGYVSALAAQMAKNIERNELMRQGATRLGIAVSEKEIDDELKSRNPPLSKDYQDLIRYELLIEKLRDEHFERQVPAFAEQRHIMAMLLESQRQVYEVRARLENGEDFATLATELSLEAASKEKGGDFGWQPRGILPTLLGASVVEEYAFGAEVGVLSPPIADENIVKGIGYWIIKITEKKEGTDEAYVHAILLGSAQEAQMVKNRLNAGEDFAALAKELSQQVEAKEVGGELGWITPGTMPPAFDDFVFGSKAEIGRLSDPIPDETTATKGGYWLVKILEADENREIEDENRETLKSIALNEWVSSLLDNPENKIDDSYLTEEKRAWAIERVLKRWEKR